VTPAEVDAKIKMLGEKLKTGTEFATLAADYSEDSQVAANSGDLGLMPMSSLDRLPPQLKATVLKMTPGSANVVSSNGTFAIVMLIERAPAGLRELTSPGVHDGIRDLLKSHKERLLRAAYIAAARDEAKVVNNLARQVLAARPRLRPRRHRPPRQVGVPGFTRWRPR
jgi:parvulin-like peptidyl-prolyl isomerase